MIEKRWVVVVDKAGLPAMGSVLGIYEDRAMAMGAVRSAEKEAGRETPKVIPWKETVGPGPNGIFYEPHGTERVYWLFERQVTRSGFGRET